jgi:uncharacterized membrane protein
MAAAQRLPILASPTAAFAFTSSMVWAFALSICLSSAPLYVFVRLSSDLVYEGRRGEAAALLLKFSGAAAALSLPVGLAAGLLLAGETPDAALLALGFAFLLAALNVLWAATMTVSVIRRYGRILAAYALGMLLMYLLARYVGSRGGASGTLMALAAGYALTAFLLIAASAEALGVSPCPRAFRRLANYSRKYRNLALAGAFYALGTWVDKIILAAFGGTAPPGGHFRVNPGYDDAFYFANLALIPGLVFYTVATETVFNLDLKRFLAFLAHRRQPEIEAAKSRLLHSSIDGLARQTVFQGVIALVLVILAPVMTGPFGFREEVFARLLAAGVFQLAFLTALNMLFYLELYIAAAASALAFLLADLCLSLFACLAGFSAAWAGLPYLAGCVAAAAAAGFFAFRGLRSFDRIVFFRSSDEDYGK